MRASSSHSTARSARSMIQPKKQHPTRQYFPRMSSQQHSSQHRPQYQTRQIKQSYGHPRHPTSSPKPPSPTSRGPWTRRDRTSASNRFLKARKRTALHVPYFLKCATDAHPPRAHNIFAGLRCPLLTDTDISIRTHRYRMTDLNRSQRRRSRHARPDRRCISGSRLARYGFLDG